MALKKYKDFFIKEMTEFNLQRFNQTSAQISNRTEDRSLSLNAFDKHQDMIRQSIAKINQIQGSLSGSSSYKTLKSKISLEEQDIENLHIIKIVNNNLNYDVYIRFFIKENEYWGVIKDITNNPTFSSEVFKDDYLIKTKEWIIKTSGLIIKNVKNFLNPQSGKFRLINEFITCYSYINGNIFKIFKDSEIEVLKSYDNKIIFEFNNEKYTMSGDNYIYFNWWFEKID